MNTDNSHDKKLDAMEHVANVEVAMENVKHDHSEIHNHKHFVWNENRSELMQRTHGQTNVMEMHRKCNGMVKNGLNNAENLWLFVFIRRCCFFRICCSRDVLFFFFRM